MQKLINILLQLGKVRITSFVSVTTALGYILAAGKFDLGIILPVLGVFILSCGSAAFNQWQEIEPDSLMDRTKKRPLPAGFITNTQGFLIALLLTLVGLFLLSLTNNILVVLLGLLALIWYNLIYTPLKKKTPLAAVPGAIIGAIPPAIGWVAAGGSLLNPQVWALSLFFFIWQIPHFWLLLLIFDNDYKKGGFPTLTQYFTLLQLTRITYMWIFALAASCLLIPFFGMHGNVLIHILLAVAGIILLWRTRNLYKTYNEKLNVKFAFININTYVLTVIILLIIDRLT